MAVYEFKLDSLMETLDGGRVGAAFEAEMRRVVLDMEDRPADKKDRTVTLTAKLVPIVDPDTGHLDEVAIKFAVTSTVPKRRSKEYSFGVRRGGVLVFNDLADDNVHQRTIDEIE